MSDRIADILAFVGPRGCGKTTQMKKFLRVNRRNLVIPSDRADSAWSGIRELKGQWRQRVDERTKRDVPYYHIPDLHKFNGARVFHVEGSHPEEMFDAIARADGFRDGGLFLDDFKNYIPAQGNLPARVLQLFRRSRHSMVDMYLAAHGFQDINAQIISFGVQWFVFDVERGPSKSVQDKMGDAFDGLMNTWRHVKGEIAAGRQDKFYFQPFPPIQ